MRAFGFFRSTRAAVAFAVTALALSAFLLASPFAEGSPASQATTSGGDKLVLTWVDGNRRLQVSGAGFRPRSAVHLRVGSAPVEEARTDGAGNLRREVPAELVLAGTPGSSVLMSGRAVSGASRVLISAVPPPAAARGPVDMLPWSLAGLGLLALFSAVVGRVRRARRARSACVASAARE